MKKNYQQIKTKFKCLASDDEVNCIGYSHGSHGDCAYRGSGSDYQSCHNPKRLRAGKEKEKEKESQPRRLPYLGGTCGDGFA